MNGVNAWVLWALMTLAFVLSAWFVWLPLSFWFGRFFCRFICPLGLCQSLVNRLFHPKAAVRRVCTELPRSPLQRFVNWLLVIAFFTLPVGMYLSPWGVFGRVLVGFAPGVIFFLAVLATAAFGKGRFWCNWVCPFGTMFDLAANVGWHADRPCKTCCHCRACAAMGGADAVRPPAAGGLTRRETLQGVAVLAAAEIAEKTTDGGLAAVSLPGVPERAQPVLPPGAASDFRLKCVGCGVCLAACPESCLKQSLALRRFGQVELDFTRGYCRTACDYRCARMCPTGALRPLDGILRTNVHLGRAVWRKDLCVRTTNGDECTACVRKCPVQAVHLVAGFPVVDADACIGCGACEHVCPARPLPAISVEGLAVQRVVRPLAEADLVAEMRALVSSGRASAVAAREGVIVAQETGSGIMPLLKLCDAGSLKGAIVVDKVIGRAAAAICVVGGARAAYALMASEDALAFLRRHGVTCAADKTVPLILNRSRTVSCPLEAAVKDLDDSLEMVNALRKAMSK